MDFKHKKIDYWNLQGIIAKIIDLIRIIAAAAAKMKKEKFLKISSGNHTKGVAEIRRIEADRL